MKINIDLSEEESTRLSNYLHARWGAKSHGKKTKLLHDALIEYLDAREKSTAPPACEKKPEKRKVPQEALAPVGNRRPDPRRLEVTNPDLAAKILEMAGRDVPIRTIAKELHLGRKQIASVIARAKE